jgi:hypothetical protein
LATSGTSLKEERRSVPRTAGAARLPVWVPYLLAFYFALWPLRNIRDFQVVDTDAARHALNGAFIYDMVRLGHATHPVRYGREYYAHLPALSMPFHPPVFPAMEALFYALFGVNTVSGRLAVALAAGICALLLYRLIQKTLCNDVLAACVTVTLLSLWTSQAVATDIMLEYPALALSLAALLFVPELEGAHPLRAGLCFAAFAIAAVWTKQHAAFLVEVPFLYAVLSGRWRLLRRKEVWIGSVLAAGGVVGVTMIWTLFRGFTTPDANMMGTSPHAVKSIFMRNLDVYGTWVGHQMQWWPLAFTLCSLAVYSGAVVKGLRRNPAIALFVSWILAVIAMLMLLGAANGRYLFWLLPGAVGLTYELLFQGSSYLWGQRLACCVAGVFALIWFAIGFGFQPDFLRGPAEAARLIVHPGSPSRIVYAGEGDGNFIFAARSIDPTLQTTVIPGEKLPRDSFAPAAFNQFCREYGVNWVVVEDVPALHKWAGLTNTGLSTLQLVNSFPLQSNRTRWQSGRMLIYRFTEPSSQPKNVLTIPIHKLWHSIEVKF